jgi:hypothetical protein
MRCLEVVGVRESLGAWSKKWRVVRNKTGKQVGKCGFAELAVESHGKVVSMKRGIRTGAVLWGLSPFSGIWCLRMSPSLAGAASSSQLAAAPGCSAELL